MSLTSGTSNYTLPTAIIEIVDMYVTSSGQQYKMLRVDGDTIRWMRISSSAGSSPAQYYALEGADLFEVYPTPAAADTLTVYYVARPAVLSVSSDSPSDVPAEWHKVIEFYALAEAADYDDDSSSQMGERYRQRYEQELVKMRRQIALKGHHQLPRASVGKRRPPVAHDRSRWPQGWTGVP